ncbi:hypothetical protein CLOP_g1396 [Closterium sp. NIES-67]|nr:hypothetical protein CLOP_g1396 [Closterium sp. NIES-67]
MEGTCWYCKKVGHPWFKCFSRPEGWAPPGMKPPSGERAQGGAVQVSGLSANLLSVRRLQKSKAEVTFGPTSCRAKLGKKVLWSLEEETSCIKDLWQLPIIPWNGKTPTAATAAAAKATGGGDATTPTDGEKRGKLEASGRWGVHLGIAKDHKGWLLWDLTTQKLTVSRDQTKGKDYDEVFASVGKGTTLRVLLAIAALLGWKIRQMDIVTAFLNGIILEEVYMKQPEGLDDGSGRWHWVRRFLDKEVRLEIVKTHQQAADIFTKRLAEADHWKGMKLAGMSVH